QYPQLKILVLSQHEGTLYVDRALREGARGYVVKDQAADEVLDAIRSVLAGQIYLARGMAGVLLNRFVGAAPGAPLGSVELLTDRELHVLHLLGTGMSTRRIAVAMKLSFKTVESHRENIKRKLGLKGAAELIHFAGEWS